LEAEEKQMALNPIIGRVRKPVRRNRAETFVLITLLSFAASVGLTRLFLELTGYPQLGSGELHIAHVLWGGLLLFSSAMLLLVLANRWVFVLSSVLAGTGVGLFIDEVGKFITQSNNYFHPIAAPIIYAFFLITVLVYLRVRRPPVFSARDEMYLALAGLSEVLDYDLEPDERAELEARLARISETGESTNYANLARSLLDFLRSEELQLAPARMGFGERLIAALEHFETRWLTLPRVKAALIGGLAALGSFALVDLLDLLLGLRDPGRLESVVTSLLEIGRVSSATGMFWFTLRVTLEGSVGLLLVLAALALLVGREQAGTTLALIGLLLSLAGVNLLAFYFDQFSSMITAGLQFLVLIGILRYRQRALRASYRP
jgi:hypothetical protein